MFFTGERTAALLAVVGLALLTSSVSLSDQTAPEAIDKRADIEEPNVVKAANAAYQLFHDGIDEREAIDAAVAVFQPVNRSDVERVFTQLRDTESLFTKRIVLLVQTPEQAETVVQVVDESEYIDFQILVYVEDVEM